MKLSVQDLNSHYGPAHILFDIALEVGDGEVVALLGRNGAGKSTTFRSIVGLVEQRTGRIVFEGKDVSDQPTHAIVRGGLGYVPEERRIFTDLTVDENLEVGRQPIRPNAPHWTREKLFTLFPNLGEMRGRQGGRTADADDRADLDGKPVAGAARRTLRRIVTEDRGADGRRDPDHEKGRRQHRGLRAKPAFRQIDLRPRLHHRARPHLLQRYHERA